MEDPKCYALIQDGLVENIIWLLPSNAGEFPDAVPYEEPCVGVGSTYVDGVFMPADSAVEGV